MSAREHSSTGNADELSEEERRAAQLRRSALASRLQMASAPAWNADGTAGSTAALGVSVPRLNLSKVHNQEKELTPRRPLPFSMRSKKLQSPSLSYLGVSSRRPTAPAAGSSSARMTSTARMGRLRDADGSATVFGTAERKVATPPEAAKRGMPRENAQRQLPTSSKLTARQAAAGEMPSFMDVLQEDPNFHISHIDGSSFVYLVPRLGSMYDLAVADPLQVDPSACITLSKAGLTFSKADGEIEFLSIDEFEREYFLYHTILKLPFFRKYKKWRIFTAWAKLLRQRKLRAARSRVKQRLFVLQPATSACLKTLKKKIDTTLSSMSLFSIDPNTTYALSQFVSRQEQARQEAAAQLSTFTAEVRRLVRRACDLAMRDFLVEHGFTGATGGEDSKQPAHLSPEMTLYGGTAVPGQVNSFAASARRAGDAAKAAAAERAAATEGTRQLLQGRRMPTMDIEKETGGVDVEAVNGARDITYSEQAAIRRMSRQLLRFVRTCDFLLLDSLQGLGVRSIAELRDAMDPARYTKEYRLQQLARTRGYATGQNEDVAVNALFKVEVHADLSVPDVEAGGEVAPPRPRHFAKETPDQMRRRDRRRQGKLERQAWLEEYQHEASDDDEEAAALLDAAYFPLPPGMRLSALVEEEQRASAAALPRSSLPRAGSARSLRAGVGAEGTAEQSMATRVAAAESAKELMQLLSLDEYLPVKRRNLPGGPLGNKQEGLVFHPRAVSFKQSIEAVVAAAVKAISTASSRLVSHAEFKAFQTVTRDDNSAEQEGSSAGSLDVESLILRTKEFQRVSDDILESLEQAFTQAQDSCFELQSFRMTAVSNLRVLQHLHRHTVDGVSAPLLRRMLAKHRRQAARLELMPEEKLVGLLRLDSSGLKAVLLPTPQQNISTLLELLPPVAQDRNEVLLEQLAASEGKLASGVQDVGQYVALMDAWSEATERLDVWREREAYVAELFTILEQEDFTGELLSVESTMELKVMQEKYSRLRSRMHEVESNAEANNALYARELDLKVPQLRSKVTDTRTKADAPIVYDPEAAPEDAVAFLKDMADKVQEMKDTGEDYQRYQRTLKLSVTPFEALEELDRDVSTKLKLWQGILDWGSTKEGWLEQIVWGIEPEAFSESVTSFVRTSIAVERAAADHLTDTRVLEMFKSTVNQFRLLIPVVTDLRCDALEARHWAQLEEVFGQNMQEAKELTLAELLEMNVLSKAADVSRIASEATQERVLLQMLQTLQDRWAEVEFTVQPFKYAPRSAFILTGWDDIQTNLDESFVMLHTILSSRYVKPIRGQVQPLQESLNDLQNVIEVWALCQKAWMTLFPIFAAPDIQRNLNTEYTTFKKVDTEFRELTRQVHQAPNALRLCEKIPGLDKRLVRYIERLEYVQRGLDTYMESKRRAFPRFYFLSDSDLLHILAAASTNPRAVSQHLLKLFDNIAKLHFEEALGSGYDIVAMESSEKEVVPLGPNLKARDAPEGWLDSLETAMRTAMRNAFKEALKAYPTLQSLPEAAELVQGLESGTLHKAQKARDDAKRRRRRRGRRGGKEEEETGDELPWETKLAKAMSAARADWAVNNGLAAQAVCTVAQIKFTEGTEAAIRQAQELSQGNDVPVGLAAEALHSNHDALEAGVGGAVHQMELVSAANEAVGYSPPTDQPYVMSAARAAAAAPDTENNTNTPLQDPRLALAAWYSTVVRGLEGFTALVRGPLSKLQRKIVVALLTTEVHNRDIVMQLLREDVRSTSSFSWQQQLRFYWGRADATATHSTCMVRQSDTSLDYQFEYEGATSRLVITPLTDRCWMTITGAFRLALGANPQGPAGTGKTESSKDLAKALGIQCIVFNCSEQISYDMMAKLFSGLAQSGAWSVLDEFNRIDIEVLSVIAQLLLELRTARLSGAATLVFNGGEPMPLYPHMIIPTMNPGYAGRTELPDNLKIFFRPVSMMVPDYALIAEIILFAEGFDDAQNLSRKMVKLYKLSSEQLSQQRHYDFGMRAVKSVLVMAGALKRGNPGLSEDVVLIRAMRDSNVPKFLADDLPLFNAIVGDLFPGVSVPETHEEGLQEAIHTQLAEDGKQPVPRFVNKVMQLRETLKVRFGVALVGQPSGKTTAYSTLAKALTRVNAAKAQWPAMRGPAPLALVKPRKGASGASDGYADDSGANKWDEWSLIKVRQLNPKSISMGELYGRYDELTQDWSDGLAASIMRSVVSIESKSEYWTVFDGPIDALWIENMNTVLDDNMMLCLANGERIKLKQQMRMLFEVADLQQASPATVSRLGVVYMTKEDVGWEPVVQSWMSSLLMQTLLPRPALRHKLWANFKGTVSSTIAHLRDTSGSLAMDVSDLSLVSSVCSLMEVMLTTLRRAAVPFPEEEQPAVKLVDRVFLWSFVWAFGGPSAQDNWRAFDLFTRGLMKKAGVDLSGLPASGTVFDCYLSTETPKPGMDIIEHGGTFRMWRELVPSFNFDPSTAFHSIIVPTVDTTRYAHLLNYLLLAPRISLDARDSAQQLLPLIARYQGEFQAWRKAQAILAAERAAAAELAGVPPPGKGKRGGRPGMKQSASSKSFASARSGDSKGAQANSGGGGGDSKEVHPWLLPWEATTVRQLTNGAVDPSKPDAETDLPFVPGAVLDYGFDFSWMPITAGGGPQGVSNGSLAVRPVFLTGGTGTGKTVLVNSLLHEASSQDVNLDKKDDEVERTITAVQAAGHNTPVQTDSKEAPAGHDAASVASWDSSSTTSSIAEEDQATDTAAADAAAKAAAAAAAAAKAQSAARRQVNSLLGSAGTMHTVPVAPVPVTFSAQTTSAGTQALIENKLERKRKGLLGAPEGRRAIVFIDDVNMPKPQEYGAQPPIELLRQVADYGGFYDRSALHWTHLQSTGLVVSGAPPGGGRNELSGRFMRHCTTLCLPTAGPDIMSAMFSAIVSGFFGTSFAPEVRAVAGAVVSSTIHVYFRCSTDLKPTPSKSYYVFNLRDVSRVVQGILMTSPQQCRTSNDAARLWAHEASRVFADRLVTAEDKEWLNELLVGELQKNFRKGWTVEGLFGEEATLTAAATRANQHAQREGDDAAAHTEQLTSHEGLGPLLFGDWLRPGSDVNAYEDCHTPHKLPGLMDGYMEEYNLSAQSPLHLVFFEDAISHIARICRVLAMPRGSALLVGVSGSGKAVLTRLAAFISGCECVSPDMSGAASRESFREDLKDILTQTGVEGIPGVLLMGDSQITDNGVLEDLNCLLNSGEIPSLFTQDDMDGIIMKLQDVLEKDPNAPVEAEAAPEDAPADEPEVDDGTPPAQSGPLPSSTADIQHAFVERVRDNLHVVLSMSPVGSTLRTRLRQFPSLLNCCTIDWFMAWPRAALLSVGERLLAPLKIPTPDEIEGKLDLQAGGGAVPVPAAAHPLWHNLVTACVDIHMAVDDTIPAFTAATKRHVYNTPRSYLDLLNAYVRLQGQKYPEAKGAIDRLRNGIKTLDDTVVSVTELRKHLEEMQPQLKARAEETAALVTQVQAEQKEVASEKDKVDAEAAVILEKQQEVEALQAEAQTELDVAMPAMLAAQEAVKRVDPAKITELKQFNNPHANVVTMMEAVCCLFGEKPSWQNSKIIMMGNAPGNTHGNFLKDMELYDHSRVTNKMLRTLSNYNKLPAMQASAMETVSTAAASICTWCHAVETIVKVKKEVEPKEKRVAEMNEQLGAANRDLQAKQAELAAVIARVEALQAHCAEKQAEKARLEAEEGRARARLQRAEKLLNGMASAGARWRVTVQEKAAALGTVIGDVLLAAAQVVYAGPFSGEFRNLLAGQWAAAVDSHRLPRSPAFSLQSVLSSPVEVNNWMINGLPKDDTSVANGILVTRAQRWPLMVDPQGQGQAWVRSMAGDNLEVVNMTSGFAEVKDSHSSIAGGAAGDDTASDADTPSTSIASPAPSLASPSLGGSLLRGNKNKRMNLAQTLERCVRLGFPLLLEECGTTLPAVLSSVLSRTVVKDGGQASVRIGDRMIPYDSNFQLFMCSSAPNPHYLPATSIRVALVNFTVTQAGLEEQLLSQAVAYERPDLEAVSSQLLIEIAADKKQLHNIEESVLEQISSAGDDILDNTALIANLSAAQTKATRVEQRVAATEATATIVAQSRDTYRPLAVRGALLYAVVSMLGTVDPMYQYSLQYFQKLFELCLLDESVHGAKHVSAARAARNQAARAKGTSGRPGSAASSRKGAARKGKHASSGASTGGASDASSDHGSSANVNVAALTQGIPGLTPDDLHTRVEEQVSRVSSIVFDNIQRGLFEKDKVLLAFLLATRLLQSASMVTRTEVGLLLRGAGIVDRDEQDMNPSARYDPSDHFAGEEDSEDGSVLPPPPSDDTLATLAAPLNAAGWDLICTLTQQVPQFSWLQEHVEENYHDWAMWRARSTPHAEPLPDSLDRHISTFQKLLLVKAFAPDKLVFGISGLVRDVLGQSYLTPPGVSLAQVHTETDPTTPCVFVLSQGADPTQRLLEFAARMKMSSRLQVVALGQGQGERAERLIRRAAVEGDWVLLQNCHLAKSWLPELARLLDSYRKNKKELNKDFRLWLTSFPAPYFPVSILQHGIKITNEPPKGVRANMQRSFGVLLKPHRLAAFDMPPPSKSKNRKRSLKPQRSLKPPRPTSGAAEEDSKDGEAAPSLASGAAPSMGAASSDARPSLQVDSKEAQVDLKASGDLLMPADADPGAQNYMGRVWRRLGMGLCFFHALVQERRKFGPLGWNIRYEFSDSDLDTSLQTLQNLLEGAALGTQRAAAAKLQDGHDDLPAVSSLATDSKETATGAGRFIGASASSSPEEKWIALQNAKESNTPVPWDALAYVIGHINYGGRVTDDWDRRTLLSMLKTVLHADVVRDEEFMLSDSGEYVIPQNTTANGIAHALSTLPDRDSTGVFGMHPNADVAFRLSEADYLIATAVDAGLATHKNDSGEAAPPSPQRKQKGAEGFKPASPAGKAPPAPAADATVDEQDLEVLRLLNDLGARIPASLDMAAVNKLVEESTHVSARGGRHRRVASRRPGAPAGHAHSRTATRRMSAVLLKPSQMAELREVPESRSGSHSRSSTAAGRRGSFMGSAASGGADSRAGSYATPVPPADASDKQPPSSLLVVLQQETAKFNALLAAIRDSMMALRRVLLGEAAMSDALEAMHASLLNGRVPALWADVAYPSMRPLASWVADLNQRVQFMARWIALGDMKEYWLPAFFFPQGFLTAVLQRHARKYHVAINDLEFQFSFLSRMGTVHAGTGSTDPSVTRGKVAADDGVTVHGLFLESGKWSDDARGLVDPTPGEVYSPLPKVRMLPTLHHKTPPGVYTCPVYKTLARAGTLSTTGISTNYVVAVELPTTMHSEHWIWRGTALVLDVMSED